MGVVANKIIIAAEPLAIHKCGVRGWSVNYKIGIVTFKIHPFPGSE